MPLYLHPNGFESFLILLWLQEVKQDKSIIDPNNAIKSLTKCLTLIAFRKHFVS